MAQVIKLRSTYKGSKPGTILTVDDVVATQLLLAGIGATTDLTGGTREYNTAVLPSYQPQADVPAPFQVSAGGRTTVSIPPGYKLSAKGAATTAAGRLELLSATDETVEQTVTLMNGEGTLGPFDASRQVQAFVDYGAVTLSVSFAGGGMDSAKFLADRIHRFGLLSSKQPLGLIDNVIDAGTMFADFSGTRLSVIGTPASEPTITRDYTGMDAGGNVTGIVSRTGLPSMVLVEPTADSNVTVGFYNSELGNITTDGLIGLWVYADLSAKVTDQQTLIGMTPFNTTGWNADNILVSYNANQLRHGWNFLVYRQRDVGGNVPGTDVVFSGLVTTKYGTGAASELKGPTLKYIEFSLQNMQGVKLYFDSLWTGFATKPQFVLGVDQASSDTINTVLPIFKQNGWVGYFAVPRRIWSSGSKIIGSWSPGAEGNFTNQKLLYDAGWDCINHTANHYALAPETNPAAIRYEVEAARAWYLQNGFVRGAEFYASPQSSSSLLSEKVIADAGFKLQRHGRHSNVHITPFGIDNPNHVGAIDIGNQSSGYQKFSDIKKWIDNIVMYGATGFPFWHTVTTLGDSGSGEDLTGNDLTITRSAFLKTMEYLRSLEQSGTINICRGMSGFWYGT